MITTDGNDMNKVHPLLKPLLRTDTNEWTLSINPNDPKNAFSGKPVVLTSDDGVYWVLRDQFKYSRMENGVWWFYSVPEGFITNLASIPHALWSIIGPPSGQGTGSCYVIAAILHDKMCKLKEVSRFKADRIFLELLRYTGCHTTRSRLMYIAVTLFTIVSFKWLFRY